MVQTQVFQGHELEGELRAMDSRPEELKYPECLWLRLILKARSGHSLSTRKSSNIAEAILSLTLDSLGYPTLLHRTIPSFRTFSEIRVAPFWTGGNSETCKIQKQTGKKKKTDQGGLKPQH